MRHNKLSLFVHLIWTTWDRLPLISSEVELTLFHVLQNEAQKQNCKVLALNGTEDHIHMLVELSPTASVSELVKQLKGVSSRCLNETLVMEIPFKWQASYGAFSVSRWDVKNIKQYIVQQKQHHASGKIIEQLETVFQPESIGS